MKKRLTTPTRRQAAGSLIALLLLSGGLWVSLQAAGGDAVPPGQTDIDRDGMVGPEDLIHLQQDWHTTYATVGSLVPFAAGNYWRYNTSYREYGTEPLSRTSTLTVSVVTTRNTTSIPGYTSTVCRLSPVGDPDRYLYLAIQNGAILLLGEGTIYPGPATVYQPPEVWVQGPAVPGKMWATTGTLNTKGVPAALTGGVEIVSATVVTPTATYRDCVKYTKSAVGFQGGVEYQATEFLWFKPGIGLVKGEAHRAWTTSPTGHTTGHDWVQTIYQYNLQ